MFYDPRSQDPKTDMGLPHDPWKALIQPRPIGWISTISKDGHANLAPYSFFNALSSNPPMVMYCNNGDYKDTVKNVEEIGDFVVNLATVDLFEKIVITSQSTAFDVDEFELAGLDKRPSKSVKSPAVAQSPAHLECRHFKTLELPSRGDNRNIMVIGEVVGIYIDESILQDGIVDFVALGRMGYKDYAVTDHKISVDPSV